MSDYLCLCGCGRTTGGEFAPGHDARYKSQLLARHLDEGDSEALVILTKRKWTKFIEPARRQREIKKDRAARAVKRERRQIAINDPSFYTNRLLVMKAACEVLKIEDQYYRARRNYVHIADWLDAMVILAGEDERVLEEVGPRHWAQLDPKQVQAVWDLIDHPDVKRLGLDFSLLDEFLHRVMA